MTILGTDDGGVSTLEGLVSQLETLTQNLTSQLGNYDNSSLEGSQSLDALNSKIGVYQQAINQYKDLIAGIKSSAEEAKRGSAMKQQAKQGYVTGLSTKRGQTYAEAMKDMADIEGAGKAERADIRSQEQQNLASAKGGLANIYTGIAENMPDSPTRGGYSSGSGGLSSALSNYVGNSGNITDEVVEGIMGYNTDNTLFKAANAGKKAMLDKKDSGEVKDKRLSVARYIFDPTRPQQLLRENIFKIINKQ